MKDCLRSLAIAAVLCASATQALATNEPPEKFDPHGDAHSRGRGHPHGGGHHDAIACSVSAVSLSFGNYNPLRARHDDTAGNIAVTCRGRPGERMSYSIELNAGGSGTFAQRRMRSGAAGTLNYNIYASAGRSLVWGDGSAGTHVVTDSFRLHSPRVTRNYAVYGRIFGGQNPRVGVYTDSIVVTLDF